MSVFDVLKEFGISFSYDVEGRSSYLQITGELTSPTVTTEPGTVFLLGLGGLPLIRKHKIG
jgi:hypothetical protein